MWPFFLACLAISLLNLSVKVFSHNCIIMSVCTTVMSLKGIKRTQLFKFSITFVLHACLYSNFQRVLYIFYETLSTIIYLFIIYLSIISFRVVISFSYILMTKLALRLLLKNMMKKNVKNNHFVWSVLNRQ